MKVRKATLADAGVIAGFNRRLAWETEKIRLDSDRLLRGVRAVLRDPSKGIYFVAELGGVVAGQLLITYEWSDWRNGSFWWIQSVYVAPQFRRRGVLRALFERVLELAGSRRDVCGLRLYVDARNRRAQAVYKRLGLQPSYYRVFETDFMLPNKSPHPRSLTGANGKMRPPEPLSQRG